MARYKNAIQTPMPAETYAQGINQFMQLEGFTLVPYKGLLVWKKGVGALVAPQYFSIQYSGNTIYLEAFVRFALLPGVYVGEMGITGFFAAIPKKLLRDRVTTIERHIVGMWYYADLNQAALQQPYPATLPYPQQQPPQPYPAPPQPYQQQPLPQPYSPQSQPYPQQPQQPTQPLYPQQPPPQPYPQQQPPYPPSPQPYQQPPYPPPPQPYQQPYPQPYPQQQPQPYPPQPPYPPQQ